MPVLIIGGEGSPAKKPEPMKAMRKSMDGIGGKYEMSAEMEPEDSGDTERSDSGRKRAAGKLLLRAIKSDDPNLAAEAVATLVACASEAQDDSGETE
jgi:hypothetical protein